LLTSTWHSKSYRSPRAYTVRSVSVRSKVRVVKFQLCALHHSCGRYLKVYSGGASPATKYSDLRSPNFKHKKMRSRAHSTLFYDTFCPRACQSPAIQVSH